MKNENELKFSVEEMAIIDEIRHNYIPEKHSIEYIMNHLNIGSLQRKVFQHPIIRNLNFKSRRALAKKETDDFINKDQPGLESKQFKLSYKKFDEFISSITLSDPEDGPSKRYITLQGRIVNPNGSLGEHTQMVTIERFTDKNEVINELVHRPILVSKKYGSDPTLYRIDILNYYIVFRS